MLPLVNLNTTEDSNLEFDVAYADAGDAQDKLEVFISVDCGLTYKNIYSKAGAALATAPQQEGAFYPTANQWRKERISLNNYRTGQVLIKLVGTNAYGNNIYVDNLYVSGAPDMTEPLALKKFTASLVGTGVELQWVTSSEENYLYFEVERSLDGKSFVPFTTVEAKKRNSTGASYKILDKEPYGGTNYYRLKIVRDWGLNPLYSQTISIKTQSSSARTASTNGGATPVLKGLYPNPSKGKFDVTYETQQAGVVHIQMVNSMGQILHSQQAPCQKGVNQTSVGAKGLPAGIYFLLLHTPGQTIKEKVIIQ